MNPQEEITQPDVDRLTIYEVIRSNAETRPSAIAITGPGREALTYQRLAEHIESVVQTLNKLGIGRGDRVAIVLPNGPELAVTYLAVASAAGAAPLNPAYLAEDFEFYLSNLNAKAMIVSSELDSPARVAAARLRIPVIEQSPTGMEAGIFSLSGKSSSPTTNQGFSQSHDEALLLHTSGTTSRPKLVPLTQRTLIDISHTLRAFLQLTPQDRCLNPMPLFHAHGLVPGILAPLIGGGSVICTPDFDATKFFHWMAAFRPTWYTAVPTVHQELLRHSKHHRDVIEQTNLRLVRSGSAHLPPNVKGELEEVFRAPVIQIYALTEALLIACTQLPPGKTKPGSVGIPSGVDVAIMDEDGNSLPPGAAGEIVVRGPTVTPGITTEPGASASASANGWLHTGDLGRLDEDGFLFITGRLKEIINRGGEKVSPSEIEDLLLEHPKVKQAIAFALPHERLGEDVAAAVVLSENESVTEQEIRDYVATRLAYFKVPSQIVVVDEIPKGPTGKLQRIGLHQKLRDQLQTHFEEPATELESTVAGLYSEVLRCTKVGASDNFFALGGDSLRATQLISRVLRDCQVELPVATMFRTPTPRGLAKEIYRVKTEVAGRMTDDETDDLGQIPVLRRPAQ